jgi:hypothetical protein
MKVYTPLISWHNRERVSSADFQPVAYPNGQPRLATGGDDKHVIVSLSNNYFFFNILLLEHALGGITKELLAISSCSKLERDTFPLLSKTKLKSHSHFHINAPGHHE